MPRFGDDWSDFGHFPKSTPIEARGGIKANSARGGFGQNWWAKRWIEVLEKLHIGGRLARGRTYARKGQVLDIDIQPGAVSARVQGSRATPYNVTIRLAPLAKDEVDRLQEALSGQAQFAARLLTNEMPQDIEEAFAAAGLSLFPETSRELRTDCSCPDWSNPCKHVAAVYYLLGEEFDRDPFLLFTLRGIDRAELLQVLGAGRSQAAPGEASAPPPPPEPLALDPALFWSGLPAHSEPFTTPTEPSVQTALLRRLGPFPLWRGERPVLEALAPVYDRASRRQ